MGDAVEARVKAERRAAALRANLKRRKTARVRDDRHDTDNDPALTVEAGEPTTPQKLGPQKSVETRKS